MNMRPGTTLPAACVFDAYGTLFDFAGPVARCAASLGGNAQALIALWRDKQLQYTWLRSLQGHYVPFTQVTADALDYALDSLGIDNPSLRDELLTLYAVVPVFPDAERALDQLKAVGVRTLILSNGTSAMLESAVRAAGLSPLIDDVLSVEVVGVYKPDPRVYRLAVDAVGAAACSIAFVSANGWDAYAAAAFGLQTIWCNRAGQPSERLPGTPARQILSLDGLPECLGLKSAARATAIREL